MISNAKRVLYDCDTWIKKTISVPEDIAESQFSFPLVTFVVHVAIMNYEKFEISQIQDQLQKNSQRHKVACYAISWLIFAWYCLESGFVLHLDKTMENDSFIGIEKMHFKIHAL